MLKTFLYYLAICIDLNLNYILHLILLFIEGKYSLKKKKVKDFLYYIKLVILDFSEELNTSKKIFVIISKITFILRSFFLEKYFLMIKV